jgi:hypothetical protein
LPVSLVFAVGDVVTVGRTLDELSKNPEISECPEKAERVFGCKQSAKVYLRFF